MDIMDIEDVIDGLSSNTKIVYRKRYEEMRGIDLLDTKAVETFISSQPRSKTKQFLAVAARVAPNNKEYYFSLMDRHDKLYPNSKKIRKSNRLNRKQMEIMSYIDELLISKDDEMLSKINKIESLTEKLILMFHYHHPLRSDLITIKFRNFDKNDNYYKNGSIHLNNPVKVNRKLVIKLDGDVNNLFKQQIQAVKYTNSDYIIGRTFTSHYYGILLKRLSTRHLNKPMTINSFRHRLSFHPFLEQLYHKMNQIAINMNHNLNTHIMKY